MIRRVICTSAFLVLTALTSFAAESKVQLSAETALGPAPVFTAASSQLHARVARTPAHQLAVWVTDQALAGALDGSRVDFALVGKNPAIVGIAAGQRNFLLAYQVRMPDFSTPLLALRVGFDGRVADATPIMVLADTRGTWSGGVAYDGSEFVIATMIKAAGLPSVVHASTLITGRVSDDGSVHPGSQFTPPKNAGVPSMPSIAWSGSRFILGSSIQFFQDANFGPWGLSAIPIQPEQSTVGAVGTAAFSDAASDGGSSMAIGGDRVTFAWMAVDAAFNTTINIAQTDLDGNPVLARTAVAAPQPLSEISSDGNVAIAWDGSEYLVAFIAPRNQTPGQIKGIRLRADGTPIDAVPFNISADGAFAEISLVPTVEGFAIAYSRADATNGGALRAFVRTLERIQQRRRSASR